MRYLLYAALLIFIIVIIILIIYGRRYKLIKEIKRHHELGEMETKAYFSNAFILNSDAGIVGEQATQIRARLTLQVTDKENKKYTAETLWLVDITAVDLIKAGNTISVKIDYNDPGIIYPSAPWARYLRK